MHGVLLLEVLECLLSSQAVSDHGCLYYNSVHSILLLVQHGVLCLRYYTVLLSSRQYLTMVVYICAVHHGFISVQSCAVFEVLHCSTVQAGSI